MKILILHNHYRDKGGEDIVVEKESVLLRKKGHKVIEYYKNNQEIKPYFWRLNDLYFSKRTYNDVKTIVRKNKPDIAHIHNIFYAISPSVYYALKDENIPMVQTVHNYR